MLKKIISGGQTGADRAALDAARQSGFPIGGSCPAGRAAEDGVISDLYPLTEIEGGPGERTRKNVIDADGTVIFHEGRLFGGTALTLDVSVVEEKPHRVIDIGSTDPTEAEEIVAEFIEECSIGVLNVAGPRASECPDVYDYVKQVISEVLRRLP